MYQNLPEGRVDTDIRPGFEGVALLGHPYYDVKESI